MTTPPPPTDAPSSVTPSGPRRFPSTPDRLGAMLLEVLPIAVIAGVYLWSFSWAEHVNSDESVSFEEFIGIMVQGFLIGAVILGGAAVWLIQSFKRWSKSTTLGKGVSEMSVVNVRTGSPATMGRMLVRELIGKWAILMVGVLAAGTIVESGHPYPLGALIVAGAAVVYVLASVVLVLVTPTHQGLWDYLAKTTVVRSVWFPPGAVRVPE